MAIKTIMNKLEITKTIKQLADDIVKANGGTKDLAIIGIETRGVPLAKRIIKEIDSNIPLGILDITLYRDDVDTMSTVPEVKETDIPFDISGKTIVIVDDVVFTGRSVRAALDELMDFGRPKKIQLAVLIDRGHRELPIEPNFVGKKITTKRNEIVSVQLSETDSSEQVILKKG